MTFDIMLLDFSVCSHVDIINLKGILENFNVFFYVLFFHVTQHHDKFLDMKLLFTDLLFVSVF